MWLSQAPGAPSALFCASHRYQLLRARKARFVPGWDTYGLPIELKVLQSLPESERRSIGVTELRTKAREYALKAIDAQRNQFKRYGIWGDWAAPYITLQPGYEAAQLSVFGRMFLNGHIYRGRKPVHWSPSSRTALAEAELEYPEGHKSRSIYVAMPIMAVGPSVDPEDAEHLKGAAFAVWTTTPWTIPVNLAVAVNGQLEYCCLEGCTYRHPLFERVSPLVLGGDYITTDTGTGLVHTAPGHGQEDYQVGLRCGLPLLSPVDDAGCFTHEAGPRFAGKSGDGNAEVVTALGEAGALLLEEQYAHKYPYDWRTKKPTIFRATSQWFASVDGFKAQSLEATRQVSWVPAAGQTRITSMTEGRNDWCISRQRKWGVPIPVFYDKQSDEPLMTEESISHVTHLVAQHGSDCWWSLPIEELLPPALAHMAPALRKGEDTMDVWFDSGSSWAGVLQTTPGPTFPADLYLEGSDQHRAFRIPLDSQSFSQLLTARFLATLRARTTKLDLSLHQRTAGSGNYIKELAAVLAKLGVCASVDACKLGSIPAVRHACRPSLRANDSDDDSDSDSDSYGQAIYGGLDSDLDFPTTVDLHCSPNIAQCLLASFPSLTALSLHGYSVTRSGLVSLLSHPQLALQLQQLDLSSATVAKPEQPEQPGAVPPDSLFRGIRLKQLSLDIGDRRSRDVVSFLKSLGLPPELEVLTVKGLSCTSGLPLLLPALPRLCSLQLPHAELSIQQDLDALLATTQLTSLQLKSVNCLTDSRAERACSWQRLEVIGALDYTSAAYLPLHSLTQPLLVGKLRFSNYRHYDDEHDKCHDYEDRGNVREVVAAAVLNLTQACRVPVKIKVLHLGIDSIHVSTPPPEWAMVRNKAGPLVSLVQPLAGRLEKRSAAAAAAGGPNRAPAGKAPGKAAAPGSRPASPNQVQRRAAAAAAAAAGGPNQAPAGKAPGKTAVPGSRPASPNQVQRSAAAAAAAATAAGGPNQAPAGKAPGKTAVPGSRPASPNQVQRSAAAAAAAGPSQTTAKTVAPGRPTLPNQTQRNAAATAAVLDHLPPPPPFPLGGGGHSAPGSPTKSRPLSPPLGNHRTRHQAGLGASGETPTGKLRAVGAQGVGEGRG
ncbi:tRNA synthetases class I-domain-containing protein [Haematococcus lacustris]